jgi:hypothetical protein
MADARLAQQRWERHRDRLLADLDSAKNVIIQVPGWQPVSLEEGLRWLQSSHYEAFHVDHDVARAGDNATVTFKIWED